MAALGVVTAIAGVFALIFFAPILGVLLGAFSGWIVGWLAPVWVPAGLALLGLHVTPDQLVYLGAALGFVGGFFRASQTNNNKES